MKIRFTLSLLLVLLVAGALNARPRTVQEAKNVAASYYSGLQQLRSAQPVDFDLVYTGPVSDPLPIPTITSSTPPARKAS